MSSVSVANGLSNVGNGKAIVFEKLLCPANALFNEKLMGCLTRCSSEQPSEMKYAQSTMPSYVGQAQIEM